MFIQDLPPIDHPSPRFLDEVTAAKFLQAARRHPDLFTRLCSITLLLTGLRQSEFLNLPADCIVQISYRPPLNVFAVYASGVGDPIVWMSGVERAVQLAMEEKGFFRRYVDLVSSWQQQVLEVALAAGAQKAMERLPSRKTSQQAWAGRRTTPTARRGRG
jgi:hypothetical protein